jgi:multidrug efflux pump
VFVEKAISEVWQTLAVAFGLVVLIIFVFLRNVRSTLIPAVAIPVSIIGTFAVLQAFGFSVNILTMLALVLAIGVVVDDAIVVLEVIYRHIEEGMPPLKAAFKGMEEISFAVIAITISLVAVFAPLAFQKSTTGRLFIEFAAAVCGSVVISAFVALTLTPAMAARILKPVEGVKHGGLFNFFERGFLWLTDFYSRGLRWSLANRWVIVIITFCAVGGMVASYRGLGKDFLPKEDKGWMFALVITPNGSTSEFTDRQLRKAERLIAEIPELKSYGAMVAPAFDGPGLASFGIVFVSFKDHSERRRSVQDIVEGPGGLSERMFAGVEGAIAIANLPKAIDVSFRDSPFELILQNQDLNQLASTSHMLANRLRALTNADRCAGRLRGGQAGVAPVHRPQPRRVAGRECRGHIAHAANSLWRARPEPDQGWRQGIQSHRAVGTHFAPHAATARHRVRARQQGRVDPIEHRGEAGDGRRAQRDQSLPAIAQRQHHRVHRGGAHRHGR